MPWVSTAILSGGSLSASQISGIRVKLASVPLVYSFRRAEMAPATSLAAVTQQAIRVDGLAPFTGAGLRAGKSGLKKKAWWVRK